MNVIIHSLLRHHNHTCDMGSPGMADANTVSIVESHRSLVVPSAQPRGVSYRVHAEIISPTGTPVSYTHLTLPTILRV